MRSKIARIQWDGEKCLTPLICKICLEICPEEVLRLGFITIAVARGVEYSIDEPGRYTLEAEWIDRCIGCMKCVDACPENALDIQFPEIETKAEKIKEKEINVDEPDFVLDFREIQSETKKYFELGGFSDKLKPREVLYILDENPLGWVEKRFRMLRQGQFKVIETYEKEEEVHKLIVHRV